METSENWKEYRYVLSFHPVPGISPAQYVTGIIGNRVFTDSNIKNAARFRRREAKSIANEKNLKTGLREKIKVYPQFLHWNH